MYIKITEITKKEGKKKVKCIPISSTHLPYIESSFSLVSLAAGLFTIDYSLPLNSPNVHCVPELTIPYPSGVGSN